MNKYDWSNVPKDVKWLAVDEGLSIAYGFKTKPFIISGMWLVDDIQNDVVNGIIDLRIKFQGNWKDSLEERPNGPTTD